MISAVAKVDFDKDLKLDFPLVSTTQISFDWRKSQFNRNYEIYTGLPVYLPSDKVLGSQAASNLQRSMRINSLHTDTCLTSTLITKMLPVYPEDSEQIMLRLLEGLIQNLLHSHVEMVM